MSTIKKWRSGWFEPICRKIEKWPWLDFSMDSIEILPMLWKCTTMWSCKIWYVNPLKWDQEDKWQVYPLRFLEEQPKPKKISSLYMKNQRKDRSLLPLRRKFKPSQVLQRIGILDALGAMEEEVPQVSALTSALWSSNNIVIGRPRKKNSRRSHH